VSPSRSGQTPPRRRSDRPAHWIHDTGYAPAYAHEGYVSAVLPDDRLLPTSVLRPGDVDRVAGWKASCECGWRSSRTYSRAEFPSVSGRAPVTVDGSATRTAAFAEWRWHVFDAVPELIVADAVNVALRPTRNLLTNPVIAAVVAIARERGVSWDRIAAAAVVTAREAKWAWSRPAADGEVSAGRRRPVRRAAYLDAASAHHRAARPTAGRNGMGAAPGT
jgi:hypothetical protein